MKHSSTCDQGIRKIIDRRKLFKMPCPRILFVGDTFLETLDLCLSLFPWAHFRQRKGAIKLHTLLNLRGNIASFIHISNGKLHEVNTLDIISVEVGSFCIIDLGYLDLCQAVCPFPGRSFLRHRPSNLKYRRVYSYPVDRGTGLIYDQSVLLTVPKSALT